VSGLLAHGIVPPSVFAGEWVTDGRRAAAEVQVYPTHVTIVPAGDIEVINRDLQQLRCRRSSALNDLVQATLVPS
jgi:hypothetical protein